MPLNFIYHCVKSRGILSGTSYFPSVTAGIRNLCELSCWFYATELIFPGFMLLLTTGYKRDSFLFMLYLVKWPKNVRIERVSL